MLGNETLEKAPNTNVCFVTLEPFIIYSFPVHDHKEISLNEITVPNCEHASLVLCCVILFPMNLSS